MKIEEPLNSNMKTGTLLWSRPCEHVQQSCSLIKKIQDQNYIESDVPSVMIFRLPSKLNGSGATEIFAAVSDC